MIFELSSCVVAKSTPSSNNFLSFQNTTGAIPKLVHITSDPTSHARTTLGWILDAWFTSEYGIIISTYTGGKNITTRFSPVNQTPTAVCTYYMTDSVLEFYKGDSATGNKWDTSTEYVAEIYICNDNYKTCSFYMDGKMHDTDIEIPATNMTMLVEIGPPASGSAVSAHYVDASLSDNTNRYMHFAFYSNYAYVDCGGKRNTQGIDQGYDGTKTNRFALSVFSDGTYIKYINSLKSTGSGTNYDNLSTIGVIRGNANKLNTGNKITAHLFKTALQDEDLNAFVVHGIVPVASVNS